MKRTILPLIALGALSFGIISVVRSQPRSQTSVPPSPPPVSPYAHAVAAEGLIEASSENISIGTPLSEVVTEVPVVVGQVVECGEPLFKLDVRQLQADVAARRADLEVAKAQVTAAAAQVQSVETQIERSTVRAPIDGEVLQVKIHVGEYAPAGVTATPLVLLGRLKPLNIRVDVDEHEAWRVSPGSRAIATVRGNADLKTPVSFVRFEPFVLPKKSLTGDSTERVDTRVLQVIYRVDNDTPAVVVGPEMEV